MKTPPRKARLALAWTMAACLGMCALADAQSSLDFVPFETSGVANPSDLEFIDLEALIIDQGGSVSIGIYNQSVPGNSGITASSPTVTRIFFEDRAGVLGDSPSIASSSNGVSFVRNDGANLPGGNRISFEVESAFTAAPPPSFYGLDPGESIVFLFGQTVYSNLVSSIASGQFRIAAHVQEIGVCREDSAAFVTVIPEPTSAVLGLLGSTILLMRRRR